MQLVTYGDKAELVTVPAPSFMYFHYTYMEG